MKSFLLRVGSNRLLRAQTLSLPGNSWLKPTSPWPPRTRVWNEIQFGGDVGDRGATIAISNASAGESDPGAIICYEPAEVGDFREQSGLRRR